MDFANMPAIVGILLILVIAGSLYLLGLLVHILVICITNPKFINVAGRNLIREKKRSFLLAGAIAFGVFVVTVVNSASAGAVLAISQNITKIVDGHIFIQGEKKLDSGKDIPNLEDKDEIFRIIEETGIDIKKINRRSEIENMELIFGDNSTIADFSGMDWDNEEEVKKGFNFKEGSLEDIDDIQGIILNQKIAEDLDVHVNDIIVGKMNTITGQVNVGDFRVIGILKGTDVLSSILSYANRKYVNQLIGLGEDDYQTIYLSLDSLDSVDGAADIIYEKLGEKFQMKKRTSSENMDFMSYAFKNEDEEWFGQRYNLMTVTEIVGFMDQLVGIVNIISISVLILLFLIIVVGVANTFRMIMYDRVKEIGSMRAMGMHQNTVRSIFLFEGFFLSLVGIIGGTLFAALVMFGLSFINLGTDHGGVFFLNNGHLLFVPAVPRLIINSIIVTVFTLLAVYFPAKKAAKLDPAKAIAAMY